MNDPVSEGTTQYCNDSFGFNKSTLSFGKKSDINNILKKLSRKNTRKYKFKVNFLCIYFN